MIHKNLKHLVTKMKSVSHRLFIYVVTKLSNRYNIQIIQVCAPTSSASDKDFYEDISQDIASVKTRHRFIIGDFNAKLRVAIINRSQYIGNFGLGSTNEQGEVLINYLARENMYCMNTFF